MKPNKFQLRFAAKLWALAIVAHTEELGVDDLDDEVRRIASENADRELEKMGLDKSELLTEKHCLEAAMRR